MVLSRVKMIAAGLVAGAALGAPSAGAAQGGAASIYEAAKRR